MLAISDAVDTPGKKEKAERLYNQYKRISFHVAYTLLHSWELAEDAVQETFIKIMRNIDKIEEDSCGKTKSLIVLITKNTAKDMLRKANHFKAVEWEEAELILDDEGPLPLNQVVSRQGYERLLRLIGDLRETYKIPCIMRLVYDLDEKTIGNLLGLSPKAVSMRIFRGRSALKKAILEEKDHLE